MSDDQRDELEKQRKAQQELQQMEQGIAFMADALPRLWWSMYTKLKEQGFTDAQSMELVKAHINKP